MNIRHDLTPNTPEWKEFRSTRIGASDFGEYITRSKIAPLAKKFSDDDTVNRFSWIGHNAEPRIREMLSDKCDIHADAVIITASFNDRIMASLDGLDDINKVQVETKTSCLSGADFEENMKYYCNQMAHQYYTINDPEYKSYLCVEKYIDNGTSEPQFYSSTIYFATFENDTCYLTIIKQFLINNNEYTEVEIEENQEPATYQILNFEQWLRVCEDFIADIDRHAEYFADETNNKMIELMLMSYKDIEAKIDFYEQKKKFFRDKIAEIMQSSDLKVYAGMYGKIANSERKQPLTEKFVKEQIEAKGIDIEEAYYSAFDYKKWAKDHKLEQPTSSLLTITLSKDKNDE